MLCLCNIFEAHLFEWHGNQLAHGSRKRNTWPLQTYFVLLLFLCMCLSKTEWTSAVSNLIPLHCVTICFRFWRSMYNRYDNDVHPRETVLDSLSSILDHNDSLQDHIKFLSSVSMVNFEFVMKCTVCVL